MSTECNSNSLDFPMLGPRHVLANFDGGDIISDGGALLLRKVEQLAGVIHQFAACFTGNLGRGATRGHGSDSSSPGTHPMGTSTDRPTSYQRAEGQGHSTARSTKPARTGLRCM